MLKTKFFRFPMIFFLLCSKNINYNEHCGYCLKNWSLLRISAIDIASNLPLNFFLDYKHLESKNLKPKSCDTFLYLRFFEEIWIWEAIYSPEKQFINSGFVDICTTVENCQAASYSHNAPKRLSLTHLQHQNAAASEQPCGFMALHIHIDI